MEWEDWAELGGVPMIVTRIRAYAVCPSCGADAGAVDHLIGTETKTAWYCDSCGRRYRLEFKQDGSVDIEAIAGRKISTVDLLVLKPQDKPVYFLVEGMRFEEFPDNDKQFYYESHSCPTNWLEPVMVYHDGDADPHGLIEFVATRDDSLFPREKNFGPSDRDRAMVEFIKEKR